MLTEQWSYQITVCLLCYVLFIVVSRQSQIKTSASILHLKIKGILCIYILVTPMGHSQDYDPYSLKHIIRDNPCLRKFTNNPLLQTATMCLFVGAVLPQSFCSPCLLEGLSKEKPFASAICMTAAVLSALLRVPGPRHQFLARLKVPSLASWTDRGQIGKGTKMIEAVFQTFPTKMFYLQKEEECAVVRSITLRYGKSKFNSSPHQLSCVTLGKCLGAWVQREFQYCSTFTPW